MILKATATLIRPENTTAYASGDEISNSATAENAIPLVFSNLTETMYGSGKILKAIIHTNTQGFNGDVRLYLFNEPPAMSGDNAPYAIKSADANSFLGFIGWTTSYLSPTGSQVSINVNATSSQVILSKDRDGGNPVYGVLVANGAITHASGQQFTVTLFCEPKTTVS
jgi:hypothetical protein